MRSNFSIMLGCNLVIDVLHGSLISSEIYGELEGLIVIHIILLSFVNLFCV